MVIKRNWLGGLDSFGHKLYISVIVARLRLSYSGFNRCIPNNHSRLGHNRHPAIAVYHSIY